MELNSYKLTKWRRLALIRERDLTTGRPCCQLCGHTFPIYAVQAHHVYPKALYPEKAYDLDNAAILDSSCHYHIVHGGNASKDLSSLHRWKEFVVYFRRQNNLKFRKIYNAIAQLRLS